MKSLFSAVALATLAATATFVATDTVEAGPTFQGHDGNVAVSGYDPVAYFIGDGKPVKGSNKIRVSYDGSIYHFSSVENAERFKKFPAAFIPEYGGHCAWAMSRGALASADPLLYKVEKGRLYLNFSKGVQEKWNKDIPGFIDKANAKWPSVPDDARFDG